MKQRVLGLDLGISSVGWAVIDDDNTNRIELIDWGSRIFEPGVDATEDEIRCRERGVSLFGASAETFFEAYVSASAQT